VEDIPVGVLELDSYVTNQFIAISGRVEGSVDSIQFFTEGRELNVDRLVSITFTLTVESRLIQLAKLTTCIGEVEVLNHSDRTCGGNDRDELETDSHCSNFKRNRQR